MQVNELVFLADFYVLDMEDKDSTNLTLLLLECPFMKTVRTKIDVYNGTLTMEFDGEVVRFNIFETIRYPSNFQSCFKIDVLAKHVLELENDDSLVLVIRNNLEHSLRD